MFIGLYPALAALQEQRSPASGAAKTGDVIRDWAIWFAIVVVVMILSLVFLKRAKKMAMSEPKPLADFSLDLDHLRAMRDGGELTIQEYDKLRQRAIERAIQRKPLHSSPGPPPARNPDTPPSEAS